LRVRILNFAEAAASGDYRTWRFEIESGSGARLPIEVRIAGTTLACQDDTLPPRVADAKRSFGRSVIKSLSSWDQLPPLILVTPDWITLFHANGYFSRIGRQLPVDQTERFRALIERSQIHLPYGQGVEQIYECRGSGRWSLQSLHRGTLREEQARMLSDVVTKVSVEQGQVALDIDPEGASLLGSQHLDDAEARVLRSLIEEWPDDTIEAIRVGLTRGQELRYDEVESVLARLFARGYVEEFELGHWQATDVAKRIRPRLLGPERATV
jgi:hypothetical protein